MNQYLARHIQDIRKLCSAHHVKSLYAFGSVVTNKFENQSDIDLLVSFEPMEAGDYADNYFLLAEKFEELMKKPIDLITDNSLSNPYFIESINKSKILIYG